MKGDSKWDISISFSYRTHFELLIVSYWVLAKCGKIQIEILIGKHLNFMLQYLLALILLLSYVMLIICNEWKGFLRTITLCNKRENGFSNLNISLITGTTRNRKDCHFSHHSVSSGQTEPRTSLSLCPIKHCCRSTHWKDS